MKDSPQLKKRTSYFRQMRALKRVDFEGLPRTDEKILDPDLEASLLIPAREASHSLDATLRETHAFMRKHFGESFEIILIPNPPPGCANDGSVQTSRELAARFDHVRVVPHLVPPLRPGKGAALRTGFFASRGKIIAFTDADLPYDLGFLEDAFRRLDQGFDLVTANRRSPESRFDIPTALLPVAYSRHRLGLLFNRVVRFLLPLPTRDTQSGMKVMSRKLATLAFSRLRCPGFFFDLEIFLTARTHGLAHAEMPITLRLNTEKSTVRVLRESVLAAYWLFRVWTGFLTGYYGRPAKREGILGNYKNLSLGNRFFLTIRWWLTPYDKMAAYIPQKGLVYDLGCGHGLFSMELAKTAPGRQVIGLDHDSARIQIAKSAAQSVRNLRFENGDLADAERYGHPDAISIIDVLHYFDFSTQEAHLAKAWRLLSQSGVLIFREVDPEGGLISKWNRYYEKIATSVGLTQSKEQDLFFRSTDDWLEILSRAGFRARAERCSHFLFADVLFIAEKKPESVA